MHCVRKEYKRRGLNKEKMKKSKTSVAPKKKLNIGWFSFSCCEDSTIVFTELLNDHFEEWEKIINFQHMRVLKRNNSLKNLDVAFVEGAIASTEQEKELKEIRKNCKKLIAIGSCALCGLPSGQRKNFSKEQWTEIEPLIKKFKQKKNMKQLDQCVKVDGGVPGCPMTEAAFLKALESILKEFNIK